LRLKGLNTLKKLNDLIIIRTHDFPACSIALQPCTLPRITDDDDDDDDNKGTERETAAFFHKVTITV
jgi:hypothetical protein